MSKSTTPVRVIPEFKECSRCKEEKHNSEYARNDRMKSGLYTYCRPCTNEVNKAWRKANPERAKEIQSRTKWTSKRYENRRDYVLRYTYGITLEDYRGRLAEQGGRCKICRSETAGENRETFVVDHCHSTGKVRGLLCYGCNVGLGHFKDDPTRLIAASEYLKNT